MTYVRTMPSPLRTTRAVDWMDWMDWMSADSGGGCQRFFFVEAIPRLFPYSYIYIYISILYLYICSFCINAMEERTASKLLLGGWRFSSEVFTIFREDVGCWKALIFFIYQCLVLVHCNRCQHALANQPTHPFSVQPLHAGKFSSGLS